MTSRFTFAIRAAAVAALAACTLGAQAQDKPVR